MLGTARRESNTGIYYKQPIDDNCMDDSPARLSEKDAQRLVQELGGAGDLPAEVLVPELRGAGLSLRQISSLTGIPFGIVRKY